MAAGQHARLLAQRQDLLDVGARQFGRQCSCAQQADLGAGAVGAEDAVHAAELGMQAVHDLVGVLLASGGTSEGDRQTHDHLDPGALRHGLGVRWRARGWSQPGLVEGGLQEAEVAVAGVGRAGDAVDVALCAVRVSCDSTGSAALLISTSRPFPDGDCSTVTAVIVLPVTFSCTCTGPQRVWTVCPVTVLLAVAVLVFVAVLE